MHDDDWLAERFEEHRARLTAVAYRMLGSRSEADDAVQEAWLRLSRTTPTRSRTSARWLTTVVVAGLPEHAAGAALAARRCRSSAELPEPAPARRPIRSRRRCSPTRSGSRCWSCSTRSAPRSASRSCCTTCSPCRSTRSRRSSAATRRRPASSRAAPGAASRATPRPRTRPACARRGWSTRSSPPPGRRLRGAARAPRPRRRAARGRGRVALGRAARGPWGPRGRRLVPPGARRGRGASRRRAGARVGARRRAPRRLRLHGRRRADRRGRPRLRPRAGRRGHARRRALDGLSQAGGPGRTSRRSSPAASPAGTNPARA